MKRLFKGPWLWIILAVAGVLVALQFIAPNGGYDEIDTSRMQSYIDSGQVKEISFIDGDQEIKATLDDSVQRSGGLKVSTHWIDGQQESILASVAEQVKGSPAWICVASARPRTGAACMRSVFPGAPLPSAE